MSDEESLRQCGFCGRTAPPAEPFGTASTYLSMPDADGGIHSSNSGAEGKSGDYSVGICIGCAFAESADPTEPLPTKPEYDDIPTEKLGSCDLCGHVGPHIGGCAGIEPRYYHLQDLVTWGVEIRGYSGNVTTCRDCTPIVPWDLYCDGDAEYAREGVADVPTRAEAGSGNGYADTQARAPEPEQALIDRWST